MTRGLQTPMIVATALLAPGAGLSACGGGESNQPSGKPSSPATSKPNASASDVTIKTFIFRPDPLKVDAGTRVTWANEDAILHTVTAGRRDKATGLFDHKVNQGDTFSYTFDKPGTYRYLCTIHMGMDATVIVRRTATG